MQEINKIPLQERLKKEGLNASFFQGRDLYLASKHKKEQALKNNFEKELKVKFHVVHDFDTDQFGTFSGEVERILSPLDTARTKAKSLAAQYPGALILSSEGSFGADPQYGFLLCDSEIIYLWDDLQKLEYYALEISYDTNFETRTISQLSELMEFVLEISFPEHGIILKNQPDDFTETHKDIDNVETLIKIAQDMLLRYPKIYAESDMRALYNPTRMKVIEKTGKKLLSILKNTCPSCNHPGFAESKHETGLKCSCCGQPTNSVKALYFTCKSCQHTEKKMYPYGKTLEDPMYCTICNP